MQNKNINVILIVGAFVLGFVVYSIYNSISSVRKSDEEKYITDDNKVVNEDEIKPIETKEPTEKPNLSSEKALDLSGQGLEKLPSYVLSRTGLEELNISNNKLTGALPSEIGKLTKLKVLNASNNLMTGVPAEIGHLPLLEVLDLSDNQLTGLPNELAQLKKLKVLNLSGNDYSPQDLEIIRKGLSPDVNIILD